MSSNKKVVAAAGLIAVGVGSANAILKYKRPPSYRFLVGSALAYFLLSAMADMGESTGEVAKGLALGVMTTVLLGEGGGLFSYVAGEAETNTQRNTLGLEQDPDPDSRRWVRRTMVVNPRGGFRSDTVAPLPGVPPTNNR